MRVQWVPPIRAVFIDIIITGDQSRGDGVRGTGTLE